LKDVFSLYEHTEIPKGDTYLRSYPYLVEYFEGLDQITFGDAVRGAHMVYGWMPTMLRMGRGFKNGDDSELAIKALNSVKRRDQLADEELKSVMAFTNNSIVGASKLLHFISPDQYPIWDSRIYEFVHGKAPHGYQVNHLGRYLEYKALIHELEKKPACDLLHRSMSEKVGDKISRVRALELVMFLNVGASRQ